MLNRTIHTLITERVIFGHLLYLASLLRKFPIRSARYTNPLIFKSVREFNKYYDSPTYRDFIEENSKELKRAEGLLGNGHYLVVENYCVSLKNESEVIAFLLERFKRVKSEVMLLTLFRVGKVRPEVFPTELIIKMNDLSYFLQLTTDEETDY